MTRPIPLRADPGALVARNVTAVARVTIAKAVARTEQRSNDTPILHSRWPDDPIAPLVLRAASQPSMLANDTALGRSVVADLISTIGPVGAGARLLQSGLQLVFENDSTIYVPGLEATANAVSFVQEGAPIPVHSLVSKAVALVPRKLATIVTLTSEMLMGSNAEALVTDALTRSVGLALDSALFDSAAADLVRPAGLRHGITALAASANTDPGEAMIEDMATLAASVSVIGGPIMFVAAPERAIAISLRARRELPFTVLASPALAADDLIAIAVNGLASAVDAAPGIEASRPATVHMEDVPLSIIDDSGTPAAPTRSLFQTDTVGIKIRFNASWALRDPRALAWMTVTGW